MRKKSKWNEQLMGRHAPTRYLYHQVKPPVPRMSYMWLSHWPKGPYGKHQTSQANARAVGCCPQTDGL